MRVLVLSLLLCSVPAAIGAQQQQQQRPLTSTAVSGSPSYRAALLDLHRSLVEVESISGNEQGAADFLSLYLTARQYDVQLQELQPSSAADDGDHTSRRRRSNVVALPPAAHPRRIRLLLTSHIDVVPPYIPYAISVPPGATVDADTVLSGRGSVDAKASLAAQITALEELLRANEVDASEVMLVYVVGEEVDGVGMRFFSGSVAENPALADGFEAVIFGEPTENKLACGHKGFLLCKVRAAGRAGHSGYPWLGKSANELLVRGLLGIVDADLGSSDRFGNTTVNIGLLHGGVAANVIPEAAEAELGVRVATGPQSTGSEAVRAKMEDVLKAIDPASLGLTCGGNGYGAVQCDCDVDGFDNITVNYGTDVPNLAGDHTRYLYGPGDILVAHSDHEALTVGDLETAVEGYKALIKHVLGRP